MRLRGLDALDQDGAASRHLDRSLREGLASDFRHSCISTRLWTGRHLPCPRDRRNAIGYSVVSSRHRSEGSRVMQYLRTAPGSFINAAAIMLLTPERVAGDDITGRVRPAAMGRRSTWPPISRYPVGSSQCSACFPRIRWLWTGTMAHCPALPEIAVLRSALARREMTGALHSYFRSRCLEPCPRARQATSAEKSAGSRWDLALSVSQEVV
jgi:hypothetical protein